MTPDVIVVGAGFSGLSAAVRLTQSGARVLVVEARSGLGGRASAFRDRVSGERVDNGQHILMGCYRETLSLLRDIGAEGHVRFQPQLAVTMIDRDGVVSRLDCSGLPAPFHLLAGVFDWSALGWSDRWPFLRMAGPIRTAQQELAGRSTRVAASPGETVEQWLIRNGQTARAREMLWDPLALAALNQPARVAAAPPFARVLGEMFTNDAKAAAIVLPTRPLDEMYAEPARRFIEEHGGQVATGRARIVVEGDRVHGATSGTEKWTANCVVCAVPWHALPDMFDGEVGALQPILDAAAATAASPIVTVHVWYDRAVLDLPFIGLPGRVMQWVFDKRHISGGESSHLTFVSSGAMAVYQKTNEELIEIATRELSDAWPQARSAQIVNALVVREPQATFSLAPGQPRRPATTTGIEGLALAGDWVDTGLPATIEGAVRSGYRAAQLLGAR